MAEQPEYYSREELAKFEQIIREKIASAETELALLKEAVDSQKSSGAEVRESSGKVIKVGEYYIEKEIVEQCKRLFKYMNQLDYALMRIKNGSYGICKATGELIPKRLLRDNPLKLTRFKDDIGLNPSRRWFGN